MEEETLDQQLNEAFKGTVLEGKFKKFVYKPFDYTLILAHICDIEPYYPLTNLTKQTEE